MEFLPFVSEDCMCIALEFTLHILEAEANKSLMTVFVGVGFTSLIDPEGPVGQTPRAQGGAPEPGGG